MTPCGDIEPGQHWFRFVAWRHRAISWTNADVSSVRSSDNYKRAISQEIPINYRNSLKVTDLTFHSNPPGANKLILTAQSLGYSGNIAPIPWLVISKSLRRQVISNHIGNRRQACKILKKRKGFNIFDPVLRICSKFADLLVMCMIPNWLLFFKF